MARLPSPEQWLIFSRAFLCSALVFMITNVVPVTVSLNRCSRRARVGCVGYTTPKVVEWRKNAIWPLAHFSGAEPRSLFRGSFLELKCLSQSGLAPRRANLCGVP